MLRSKVTVNTVKLYGQRTLSIGMIQSRGRVNIVM